MRQQVEALIDEVIRPLVEADGGEVSLVSVSEDKVVLKLSAACAGCPGAHYTTNHVIVPLFADALGEEIEVEVQAR